MDSGAFDGVVVVGGGFAGLHAARALRSVGAPFMVVDPETAHGFVTRLAAVAGGTAPVGDAFAPLDELVEVAVPGRVARIDDGRVELADGAVIEAQAVIVAAGSVPSAPPIPGLRHAGQLRTPADAIARRAEIAAADALVVVGGGATGVQLAGAAAAARPGLDVHLIEREPRLLATLPAAMGRHAARILRRRGVSLHLGEEIARIVPSGVRLGSGALVRGRVVWAGGFDAAVGRLGEHLPQRAGRIDVDSRLRVRGWERTFAVGDVAAHTDRRGRLLPMSAQIAVRAGHGAGINAARVARGRRPAVVPLRQLGWVLDLGAGRGVAQVGPAVLALPALDRLPPLLHYGIDAKNLVEIGGLRGLRYLPGRHQPDDDLELGCRGSHRVSATGTGA